MKDKYDLAEGIKVLARFWRHHGELTQAKRNRLIKEHFQLTLRHMQESFLSFEIGCHFAFCEMSEKEEYRYSWA